MEAWLGLLSSSTIENCYVINLNINNKKAVTGRTGGLTGGNTGSNIIVNCYTEGKIKAENPYVGGLIGGLGADNVENCYSKVNISTTDNNVGGLIGGALVLDANSISNNLSIGNIYTSAGLDGMNRIQGSTTSTTSTNYAYKNQLLNGYILEENKGATLLDEDEILNLNLGDNYNYDDKAKGILPKLYNTEGTKLLPNQEDIYITESLTGEESSKISVDSINAEKTNQEEANISILIINPDEIEITNIEIEDMTVKEVVRNVTQKGMTNITVRATPTRYYDSYKLIGIKYRDSKNEEKTKEVENEVEVQFFKEIYTYEDWQSIEKETYQNYKLMADIDFSGKSNINNNITVNRLEAENNIYTLKNIELEYNTINTGLINNVKATMKNIGFENVTLTNKASSGNYFGVIAINNGKVENLSFKNVTINAASMEHVGIIGSSLGGVDYIKLENVTIEGKSSVGGLAGRIDMQVNSDVVSNINGDNITVKASGQYCGGVVGIQNGAEIPMNDIILENSNIEGWDYTGGIVGYITRGKLQRLEINNTNVSGHTTVGGIIGYSSNDEGGFIRKYIIVKASTITGSGYNNIGGVVGKQVGGTNEYWTICDSEIRTTYSNPSNIGGLAGNGHYATIAAFQVIDTKIISSSGINVGGVVGKNEDAKRTRLYQGYVNNTTVQGNLNVGGLYGSASWATINNIYANVNISAFSHTAGGLIGYVDNTYMQPTVNTVSLNSAMLLDSSVSAPTKVGGMFGNIATEIYRGQSFYYNNYIEAKVTSENSSTGSLLIGGRPDENDYIKNTYVYKYSKLNDNYVYATNDNVNTSQYLVRTDLDYQNTYSNKIGLGTTYWNYASLAEGKYPTIKDSYLYQPELQTGVDLPTDPEITDIGLLNESNNKDDNKNNATTQSDITAQNSMKTENTLPSYAVYPISVNEINIDFNKIINEYNSEINARKTNEQQQTKF